MNKRREKMNVYKKEVTMRSKWSKELEEWRKGSEGVAREKKRKNRRNI